MEAVIIINLHSYVSSVLTPLLAAVHIRSRSKPSLLSVLVPSAHMLIFGIIYPSWWTCSPRFSHTSACRVQLLRCWKRLLPPSFPRLLLSTPFPLPHKLPKPNNYDPDKSAYMWVQNQLHYVMADDSYDTLRVEAVGAAVTVWFVSCWPHLYFQNSPLDGARAGVRSNGGGFPWLAL